MAKLGRKVRCRFDRGVKCVWLFNGHRSCVVDESSEEQSVRGEMQYCFCPLLPEREKAAVQGVMSEMGFRVSRSWFS